MQDDISLLIKEAKPLYFARKRRRKQIGSLSIMAICLLLTSPFLMNDGNQAYIYNFDGLDEEINLTQNGTVIADMGFPTDEYGLLKIG